LAKGAASSSPPGRGDQSQPAVKAGPGAAESPAAQPPPAEPGQVRAGHYAFKLLGSKLEPYSTDKNGNPQKFALRLSLRVTDVMGTSDYVDRRTIRLAVDGAELMPENAINFAVYDRQSAETEALFLVPADASAIALLFGRPEDTVAKLPLPLNLNARR